MGYILLILLIINSSIAFATFFKRKFEENLVLTIVSYITIIFLTGVFGNLNIGFYLILLLNLLLLGYNIYSIIKKKVNLQEQVFTFGFILFVITYILILWVSAARNSVQWDEFSHWSLVTKNMFKLGNLGLGEDANLLCRSYLSGTSMFQFFCTKLSGEFKEGMLYIGMNIMIVSTIIPMFKNLKSRRRLIAYICYGIMFFIPMYFYPTIYKSIYVDGILALAFAYTLYSYFTDKDENLSKFKVINLMASFLFLGFIKNFGLVLAAGCLFIILVDNIFIRNKFSFKTLWKNSKFLWLAIIPMILVEAIWLGLLKYNKINDVETSGILPTILNFVKGDLLPYQETTAKNYILALFETPLTIGYPFSFIMCICLSIILAYIVVKQSDNKKIISVMLTLSIVGAFAYAVLLLFVPFLSLFSEYEATRLASYARYMNSYILGLILIEMAIIITKLSENKEKFQKFTLIFFTIFVVTFPFGYIEQFTILARSDVQGTIDERSKFNDFERLLEENVQKDEKVYFIATNTNGFEYYVAKYIATPIKMQIAQWSISEEPYYEGDIWTTVLTAEQWSNELINNYEYVYLYTIDEKFIANYGRLFYNGEENIRNNQLYKINKTEGTEVTLELIGE